MEIFFSLGAKGLNLNPIICRNRHDDYYTVDCKALRNSDISVKQPHSYFLRVVHLQRVQELNELVVSHRATVKAKGKNAGHSVMVKEPHSSWFRIAIRV